MYSIFNPLKALAVAAAAGSLAACASGLGGDDYSRSDAYSVARIETGVIVSSQPANIEGTKSGIGTATGAVVGGAAGSQIGGGDEERVIAGVLGAVVGGIAGSAIEEGTTRQAGTAYYVRLDKNGETVRILQADAQPMPNGTPVLVEYGARPRVVPQGAAGYYPPQGQYQGQTYQQQRELEGAPRY